MSAVNVAPPRFDDPARFGRVAVLMGGTSSEREVSLNSGQNVLEALLSQGVQAFAVDGVPALVEAIRVGRVDRVFNILHGGDGENGVLQGLLQSLGVPYTGPGVLGSALTMDKIRTKQVWIACGLPTPEFVVCRPGDDIAGLVGGLGLPVVVKPAHEGSSVGVSRVRSPAELSAAFETAARHDTNLLVERLIEGDELTVAILDGEALPSIRIVPAGEYYDWHAKYVAEDTQYLCPGLEGNAEAELRALALEAFRAAGCSGWGRVDVMRDRAGGLWLLEANTTPGMTGHSLVPKAAAAVGIDFPSLCWRILETSFGGARP